MLALQSQVIDQLVVQLNSGEYPFIKKAFVANAQSKVLLVEFHDSIALSILKEATVLGALPYPVGAESRYDVLPLFYKVSGTFLKANPHFEQNMIRINPNRAGVDTVTKILVNAYKNIS